jgi:anaerobic selenocysteine-containing dehydrogenase
MVRRWVKWTPPILPGKPEQRHAWEILRALAARFVGQPEEAVEEQYVDMWLRTFLDGGDNPLNGQVDFDEARRLAGTMAGPDRLFDILLRTGRFGDAFGLNKDGLTLERLAQHPEGMDFGPMEPQLPGLLKTPDGKIDLVPEVVAADMARLRQSLESPREGLLLIGRRHPRSKNSWMHNLDMLTRGKDRCTVMIHPHDARPLDIGDGDAVTVSTQWGTLRINAEVTDEIMPGVLSIPHGWGHGQRGTRMGVANDHPGVNVNAIISEKEYDAASSISVVNGISVCIEKVVEGDPAMT